MATRRPSGHHGLTTPPATPTFPSNDQFKATYAQRSVTSPLTPPESPVSLRSPSDGNAQFQQILGDRQLHPRNISASLALDTEPTSGANSEVLVCPFDLDLSPAGPNHAQNLGLGAWSNVIKATIQPQKPPSDTQTTSSLPIRPLPRVVAVKKPARLDAIKILTNEAKILSYLAGLPRSEDFIISFYGVLPDQASLVLALVPLSLETFIRECAVMSRTNLTSWNMLDPVLGSIKDWLNLARTLISGLAWLHDDADVVHGDIKPGNFLLRPKDKFSADTFPYDPLFIDFSSSHRLAAKEMPINTLSAVTREYTAPELLVSTVLRDPKATASTASDVFSMAVTLLVAATGNTMVYTGSMYQRQAMATQGWQVISLVRSSDYGARLPKHGVVEKVLERAVLKAGMGRVSAQSWLALVEEQMLGEPRKKL
jgi:serine/threonine protein kinase